MKEFRGFDDMFKEFEKMFREIEQRMQEMMKEAFSPEAWDVDPRKWDNAPNVKTYYWGYRAEIGPDGVPRIETFGNVAPPMLPLTDGTTVVETPEEDLASSTDKPRLSAEPITDVIVDDQDDVIRVIMELPGVTDKNVKIDVTESTLKVEANSEFKRFYKEVTFPHAIDPKSMKKTIKNGILELKFKFKNEKEPKRRFRIRLP